MGKRIIRQRVRPTSATAPSTGQRPNSVNLSGPELDRLLAEMEDGGDRGEGSKHRDFVRWQFRPQGVEMRLEQSGGGGPSSRATVRVACRNLSRGGMSILHGSYIHPGAEATILLKNTQGQTIPVPGTIVRCRHVRGMVHELGVQFTIPISPSDFVRRDPFSDSFSLERVDPAELTGCVVSIEDSPMDQRLIQHYLRGTQLRLRPAASPEEALPLIAEGCDLVLCDYDLGGATLPDVVERMRADGIHTPVIAVTADTSAATRDRLLESQVSAFLAKPLSQSLLMRALAEFLMVDSASKGLRSTLADSDPNRVLIEPFVQQVRQHARKLVECLEREDTSTIRSICLQIRGTAPMLGFTALGKIADAAANAVASSVDSRDAAVQVRALIAACERIQA